MPDAGSRLAITGFRESTLTWGLNPVDRGTVLVASTKCSVSFTSLLSRGLVDEMEEQRPRTNGLRFLPELAVGGLVLGLTLCFGENRLWGRRFGFFLGDAVGLGFPVVVVPCVGDSGGAFRHDGGLW